MQKEQNNEQHHGHPLIGTLKALKGNPKWCVLTEPLWGVPYNLFMPFFTVYMNRLGLDDTMIGTVLSVGLFFQMLFSLSSGILADKMGRRKATAIFDTLAWSIPCLIWLFAQNYWWFVAAAVVNGARQVTTNSWYCLLVEDAEQKHLVNMFTWVAIASSLVAFFSPLSSLLMGHMELIPAMRILFGLAFCVMTFKFIFLYFKTTETRLGRQRMEQTKNVSAWSMFVGYKDVLKMLLGSRRMLTVMLLLIIMNVNQLTYDNFFYLYVDQGLGIPATLLPYFPFLRALLLLLILFFVQSRLNHLSLKAPMLVGFAIYTVGYLMLIFCPPGNVFMVMVFVALEAFAHALVFPRRNSMQALFIDPTQRARITALMYVVMLGISTPFGYLIGWLSSHNRTYPFILSIALYVVIAVVIWRMDESGKKRSK